MPEQVMSLYVLHSPSADGRSREANGVRVGAGDAFVQLVTVHLGNEPHVHGRNENVEAVSVEQRYGLPAVGQSIQISTCG